MPQAVTQFSVNPAFRRLAADEGMGSLAAIIREELTWIAINVWFKHVLPKHFKREAYQLYAPVYAPRTKRYEIRKRRKMGHGDPWVYSGETRNLILKGTPTVREGRGRGSTFIMLRLPFARKMNFFGRGGRNGRHNFKAAMAYMNEAERGALNRLLAGRVASRMRAAIRDGAVQMRPETVVA